MKTEVVAARRKSEAAINSDLLFLILDIRYWILLRNLINQMIVIIQIITSSSVVGSEPRLKRIRYVGKQKNKKASAKLKLRQVR